MEEKARRLRGGDERERDKVEIGRNTEWWWRRRETGFGEEKLGF